MIHPWPKPEVPPADDDPDLTLEVAVRIKDAEPEPEPMTSEQLEQQQALLDHEARNNHAKGILAIAVLTILFVLLVLVTSYWLIPIAIGLVVLVEIVKLLYA